MSERAPYSRVYWTIRSDPRLEAIYPDNCHLATWLRLLIAADMAWPAPADIPASVNRKSLQALEAAGVIEVRGSLFVFHGLDTERGARRAAAQASIAHRWNTERSTDVVRPNTGRITSRDETRRAEQSRDDARAPEKDRPDIEAFLAVRYKLPTDPQRALMDAYCRVFDETGPERAARLIYANPDDPIGALKADLAAFRAERKAEAEQQEAPKPAPRRQPARGLTGINAELAAILKREYEGNGAA